MKFLQPALSLLAFIALSTTVMGAPAGDTPCSDCDPIGSSGTVNGPGGAFVTWNVLGTIPGECSEEQCNVLERCGFSYSFGWYTGTFGNAVGTTFKVFDGSMTQVEATVTEGPYVFGPDTGGGDSGESTLRCDRYTEYQVAITFSNGAGPLRAIITQTCLECNFE
jgi:hypothetical protein